MPSSSYSKPHIYFNFTSIDKCIKCFHSSPLPRGFSKIFCLVGVHFLVLLPERVHRSIFVYLKYFMAFILERLIDSYKLLELWFLPLIIFILFLQESLEKLALFLPLISI